jgi:phosphohistidine swiveling domain-containing protein
MVQGPTETIGKGSNLFAAGQIRGTARWFHNPGDVVGADEDDLPQLIGFVGKGGMTFLSPILAELKAVVCTAGSLESHLAILAREFEIPCVMGAELLADIADGEEIILDLEDDSQAVILRGGGGQ